MSFMVMCVEVVFTSRTSFRVKYGRRWRARESMDSGSSCDDDWEKLMGRLDGSGSLVDG